MSGAERRGSRARKVIACLLTGIVVTAVASEAGGATQPPAPQGVAILAPGALPHVCGAADGKYKPSGYAPVMGAYYSKTANAWLSAPLCYPRWLNLKMSAPQVAAGGTRVTVTAIPTDGSNSAEWAVKPPGAVRWAPAGTPVAGCKPTTLTCTVKLPAAGAEWQWLMFQVSMPRTYFIDSPGEFCAGQHACPGTATQGWTFVAVPPKGQKAPEPEKTYSISGRVRESRCGASACTLVGLAGVTVSASGPGGPVQATTNSAGAYTLPDLKPGIWTVLPGAAGKTFSPGRTPVLVREQDIADVDFQTCGGVRTTQARATRARADNEAFCRLLSAVAVPRDLADVKLRELPVKLDYEGVGWDPAGGPIAIGFGGKPVTKIPQAATFKKRLYATEWPQRDNLLRGRPTAPGCSGTLTATQAGMTRIITLSTRVVAVVLFADGDKVLRTGDAVCAGEEFVLKHSAGTVVISDGIGTLATVWVYQPRGGIDQEVTMPPGGSLCVQLRPTSHGHAIISRRSTGTFDVRKAAGPCPK